MEALGRIYHIVTWGLSGMKYILGLMTGILSKL